MEEKAIIANIKSIIEKINLFLIPQIIWLIEFYYLSINVCFYILTNLMRLNFELPIEIINYNEEILEYIENYKGMALACAIGFVICGVVGTFFKKINMFAQYKLIYKYCDFGIYFGGWLFIIYFTYLAYSVTSSCFLILPVIIWSLVQLKWKVIDWLNDKGIMIG